MKKFSKDVHFKKIVRPSFFLLFFVGFVMPIFIHAATFSDLVNKFVAYVNVIVYLLASLAILINVLAYTLISLAVVVFLFGVFRYLVSGADEEARKTGRTFMVWGIASLFIMVSVWGLVNIFKKTLILNDTRPATPQF